MPTKIENIKELKESKSMELTEEQVIELQKELKSSLTPEQRTETVKKLDEMLTSSDINFIPGLVGFADLFSSIFLNSLRDQMPSEEDRKASAERMNNLRYEITQLLNNQTGGHVAEDIVCLLGLIIEGALSAIPADENN